jgi:hypothetical protein
MSKPTELFWVDVQTAPGDRLRYREYGGGKFTRQFDAEARRDKVVRSHPSARVRIFRTETNWVEVTE